MEGISTQSYVHKVLGKFHRAIAFEMQDLQLHGQGSKDRYEFLGGSFKYLCTCVAVADACNMQNFMPFCGKAIVIRWKVHPPIQQTSCHTWLIMLPCHRGNLISVRWGFAGGKMVSEHTIHSLTYQDTSTVLLTRTCSLQTLHSHSLKKIQTSTYSQPVCFSVYLGSISSLLCYVTPTRLHGS